MPSSHPSQSAPHGRPAAGRERLHADTVGHQFQPTWWCLKDVELECRTEELLGLIGPNGSGKTTLLRILAGQLEPTTGRVWSNDEPLSALPRRAVARRIGYLPQEMPAAFSFSVEEVIAQGRFPHQGALGVLTARDRDVLERVMTWTTTHAFARRAIDSLSGGERQRVMLASVLAQESDFLLLDEPTSALDPHHQVDVFSRLKELAGAGLGVVIVTHDLNLAGQYCDRLVLLHEGRVAEVGAPASVLTQAALERVYETKLIVDRNPVTGTPLVVLLGRQGLPPGEES